MCASVATKVISSGVNWQNTPLITGLKSSFPVANNVLFIALEIISPEIFNVLLFSIPGVLGYSSPL